MNNIRKVLKQRPPFLMVDKIIERGTEKVKCQKFISENDPILVGHFPNNPMFPGVLEIEFAAQSSMFLKFYETDTEIEEGYLVNVEKFTFYQTVKPGDIITSIVELEKVFGNFAITRCKIIDSEGNKVARGVLRFFIKAREEK